MLATARGRRDRLKLVPSTPKLDTYGQPTGHTFDVDAAVPLTRARLARPSATVQVIEGITLAEDEALLIVLRRFDRPAGTFLVQSRDGLWAAKSDPVERHALASGIHTVVHLRREESRFG